MVHAPPTHTYHPTTKKELRRLHLRNPQQYEYQTPGSFDHINDGTNSSHAETLRLTMLKQEIDQERKEEYPETHLEGTWMINLLNEAKY